MYNLWIYYAIIKWQDSLYLNLYFKVIYFISQFLVHVTTSIEVSGIINQHFIYAFNNTESTVY